MTRLIALALILPLAACSGGVGGGLFGGRDEPELVIDTPPAGGPVAVAADPSDPAAAAAPTPAGDGLFIGFTVASLGDATVPGLWLETPLVTEEGPGRVVAENGMQLFLTLRPSGGARSAGSRLSLGGFQALGLDITSLPTLTVISDA
ncbi:hypothetical protein [Roseicyclus persicicus]|uniref:D-galactarate dehydratase n=1 Tax=Roseicyclus persicicus TaxID=2650661 RepID=A0A7X6GYC3_9RHOB|nr:hypothetical protein [Roseibacterium persicicum]NKX43541.1 hypothetical protein [Roseibacterium persicicum]